MGVSQIGGTIFRGPYNKDYSILGSILGSPDFGKLPYFYVINIHTCISGLRLRIAVI